LGQSKAAERLVVADRHGPNGDAWTACARGETWLADRKGAPTKPIIQCITASKRPVLDGRLDDAVWKQARPVSLQSPLGDDQQWPATVMLAHDEEFLYLAIECRKAPGAKYEPAAGNRTRDPDLSDHDRVEFFIDLDRDYATYYHLAIDHRGWATDSCLGDSSWNPKWFIAARTAEGSWTAEAAIPLRALSSKVVRGETVWAIGIQRTVPGVGFQSWTRPASTRVMPEGFGWVKFE
jgi:hypothetical protein